jgi:hypothetical protein
MTLEQLHRLRLWHLRHGREQPLEKHIWDMVLTFWLTGWVGTPTALVLHAGWAIALCPAMVFLPGSYVALRRRLHSSQVVRCDWIEALRR